MSSNESTDSLRVPFFQSSKNTCRKKTHSLYLSGVITSYNKLIFRLFNKRVMWLILSDKKYKRDAPELARAIRVKNIQFIAFTFRQLCSETIWSSQNSPSSPMFFSTLCNRIEIRQFDGPSLLGTEITGYGLVRAIICALLQLLKLNYTLKFWHHLLFTSALD